MPKSPKRKVSDDEVEMILRDHLADVRAKFGHAHPTRTSTAPFGQSNLTDEEVRALAQRGYEAMERRRKG